MRIPARFAVPVPEFPVGATYDFFLEEKENGREGCHAQEGLGTFFMFNSAAFLCGGFDIEVPD